MYKNNFKVNKNMIRKKIGLDFNSIKELWLSSGEELRKKIEDMSGVTRDEFIEQSIEINIKNIRRDRGYVFSNNFSELPVKWSAPSKSCKCDVPLFKTESTCMSAIAMSKLEWLMDEYNSNWKPDWKNHKQEKYCIVRKFLGIVSKDEENKDYMIRTGKYEYCFLTFRTKEIAEKFLEEQLELVKEYFGV